MWFWQRWLQRLRGIRVPGTRGGVRTYKVRRKRPLRVTYARSARERERGRLEQLGWLGDRPPPVPPKDKPPICMTVSTRNDGRIIYREVLPARGNLFTFLNETGWYEHAPSSISSRLSRKSTRYAARYMSVSPISSHMYSLETRYPIIPYEVYQTLQDENAALRERIRDLEKRITPPLSPESVEVKMLC